MQYKNIAFLALFFLQKSLFATQDCSIIGLLIGNNQAVFLPNIIHALSNCVDSIIFFDLQSADNTKEVIDHLQKTLSVSYCNIDQDMTPSQLHTFALEKGRNQGGTHFVLLYAHELPTAEFVMSGRLKKTIKQLKNGESLYLPVINIDNDYCQYLQGTKKNFVMCAFADNAYIDYNSTSYERMPQGLNGKQWYWQDEINNGLMISYDYLFKYYALQGCNAHIRNEFSTVIYINNVIDQIVKVGNHETEKQQTLYCWFASYTHFFNNKSLLEADTQLEKTVLNNFQEHGIDYFISLNIWDYDWHFFEYLDKTSNSAMQSQYKQDLFIHAYLCKNKQNGFFVDVGAHNGIKWSNSYFFEKECGWLGICIEPIKAAFDELKTMRNAICINACAGKKNEKADFFNVQGSPDQLSGLVKSYHPSHKKRMEKEVQEDKSNIIIQKISVYTLQKIFEEHNITYVDYLSLDTEGSEMEILQGIDFDQVYIKAMTIENMYFGKELSNFMLSKGFKKVARLFNCDDVYVNIKKS